MSEIKKEIETYLHRNKRTFDNGFQAGHLYSVRQIESWNGETDTEIGRALKAKFEEKCWIPKPE